MGLGRLVRAVATQFSYEKAPGRSPQGKRKKITIEATENRQIKGVRTSTLGKTLSSFWKFDKVEQLPYCEISLNAG